MVPTGSFSTLGTGFRPALSHSLGNRIADDVVRFAPAGGVILIYGRGTLFADRAAEPAARLILCEMDPDSRVLQAGLLSGNAKIFIRKAEDIATMTPQSVDVVVTHSVSQHIGAADFDGLIRQFRRLLRPGGLLVVGDVLPRRLSRLADAIELLRFGAQNGLYGAALAGLLRGWRSGAGTSRRGLSRYDDDEMLAKLEAAGYSAQRARTNIGHNNRRMTFLAHAR